MIYVKYAKRQDCCWKQNPCKSGETSINLSLEICEFLTFGMVANGEEFEIPFLIHKQDFYDALEFIKSQCPLYKSSSQGSEAYNYNSPIFAKLKHSIKMFFGENESQVYIVTLYNRQDRRIYLKGLTQNGFNIRNFLVENSSALQFAESEGMTDLRLLSAVYEGQFEN